MSKKWMYSAMWMPLPLLLTGCGGSGEKTASMVAAYGVLTVLALAMLIACCAQRKNDIWYLALFAAVFIVNSGYTALSAATVLEEALLANRIAYLGSVLLPIAMLMIVLRTAGIPRPRWLPGALLTVGLLVFLVAASPGYLDIYYREVYMEQVGGGSVLRKVYGPWHGLYGGYLAAYFVAMLGTLLWISRKKKKCPRRMVATFVVMTMGNMSVWLLEQFIQMEFELLSVSYLFSELLLLGIDSGEPQPDEVSPEAPMPGTLPVLKQADSWGEMLPSLAPEPEKPQGPLPVLEQADPCGEALPSVAPEPEESRGPSQEERALLELFRFGLSTLTQTERAIYGLYLEGKTTGQILAALEIKENTLKFHNKNLYGKLGVSSRRQLLKMANLAAREEKPNIS